MPTSQQICFGVFTFDLDRGELFRRGVAVRLQPQPARVLALLIANAGHLVTREEIRDAVWGERHVEFDQGLNFSIRQIREILGDRAEAPTFIETIPRRGYRFIASIEMSPELSFSQKLQILRPKCTINLKVTKLKNTTKRSFGDICQKRAAIRTIMKKNIKWQNSQSTRVHTQKKRSFTSPPKTNIRKVIV